MNIFLIYVSGVTITTKDSSSIMWKWTSGSSYILIFLFIFFLCRHSKQEKWSLKSAEQYLLNISLLFLKGWPCLKPWTSTIYL